MKKNIHQVHALLHEYVSMKKEGQASNKDDELQRLGRKLSHMIREHRSQESLPREMPVALSALREDVDLERISGPSTQELLKVGIGGLDPEETTQLKRRTASAVYDRRGLFALTHVKEPLS